MTWEDHWTARQQLTDEFVGVQERARQREQLRQIERTKAAIRATQPKKAG